MAMLRMLVTRISPARSASVPRAQQRFPVTIAQWVHPYSVRSYCQVPGAKDMMVIWLRLLQGQEAQLPQR